MTHRVEGIPDPRSYAATEAAPAHAALHALAARSLEAVTAQEAARADADVRARLAAMVAAGDAALADLVGAAPSVALARYLWRELDAALRPPATAELAVTLFALPLVLVAGVESDTGEATLPGVLADTGKLVAILREHGALGGNRTFALANVLAGAATFDLARLAEWRAWQALGPGRADARQPAPAPAPIAVAAGAESVHLRFLVGTTLARGDVDLTADTRVGGWGAPLTRELARELGFGAVRVLALPRAPQRPLPAVVQGRLAQREVSAQIFASNAIRRLRAAVGEPSAVISAHRTDAGGEVRLSLSSPFSPRDAEGFRCPLYPLDRVGDVVAMLTDLMADCRVTDVRGVAGVHPDRDPVTGLPLLFKPETIPGGATALH
jgi:hypothetical protein